MFLGEERGEKMDSVFLIGEKRKKERKSRFEMFRMEREKALAYITKNQ